jgi:hypothetical protein
MQFTNCLVKDILIHIGRHKRVRFNFKKGCSESRLSRDQEQHPIRSTNVNNNEENLHHYDINADYSAYDDDSVHGSPADLENPVETYLDTQFVENVLHTRDALMSEQEAREEDDVGGSREVDGTLIKHTDFPVEFDYLNESDRRNIIKETGELVDLTYQQEREISMLKFLLKSGTSEMSYRDHFATVEILAENKYPKCLKTFHARIDKLMEKIISIREMSIGIQNETISYVDIEDLVRFWMSNAETSARIENFNHRSIHPFIMDLDHKIAQLQESIKSGCHLFAGFETGTECYESLRRTSEYWKPNMKPHLTDSTFASILRLDLFCHGVIFYDGFASARNNNSTSHIAIYMSLSEFDLEDKWAKSEFPGAVPIVIYDIESQEESIKFVYLIDSNTC